MASPDVESVSEDYYSSIEAHFISLRGSPLFISPKEWSLIHEWEEMGIPTQVVFAAIDEVFSRPKAYDAPRRLGYCRQTVAARFRRFCEARLGAEPSDQSDAQSVEALPTSAEHLEALSRRLDELAQSYRSEYPVLARALADGSSALVDMRRAVETQGDDVEEALRRLESLLLECAEDVHADQLASVRAEAERAIGSYRSRMPPEVFESAIQSGYRRRLRRIVGLPSLSLFDR